MIANKPTDQEQQQPMTIETATGTAHGAAEASSFTTNNDSSGVKKRGYPLTAQPIASPNVKKKVCCNIVEKMRSAATSPVEGTTESTENTAATVAPVHRVEANTAQTNFNGTDGTADATTSEEATGTTEDETQENAYNAPQVVPALSVATSLTAILLEHILNFLPEACFSSMKRVCRSWNNEIGAHSPDLWRHYLRRRKWPMPLEPTPDDVCESVNAYRNTLVSHHEILRTVRAVKDAMAPIQTSSETQSFQGNDWVARAFSNEGDDNECVGVKMLSSTRMISVHSFDSLYLIEAWFEQNENGGVRKICREVACGAFMAGDYCTIDSMDMDDKVIVCLCNGLEDVSPSEPLLIAITREDFLRQCEDNARADAFGLDHGTLHIVNIRDEVRRYFEITYSRALSDFTINVFTNAVACWNGLAFVEVEIDSEAAVEGGAFLPARLQLVVVSLGEGTVVSAISRPVDGRQFDLSLACERKPLDLHGSPSSCRLAISNSFNLGDDDFERLLGQVQITRTSSQVHAASLGENLNLTRSLEGNWKPTDVSMASVTASASDFVVVESARRGFGGTSQYELCLRVLFLPLDEQSGNILPSPPEVLQLDESGPGREADGTWLDCVSLCVECVGNYAIIVSRFCTVEDQDMNPLEHDQKLVAIIIHIPTRQKVDSVVLTESNNRLDHFDSDAQLEHAIFMSSLNGTLGVGVSNKGVIMVGGSVLSLGETLRQGNRV